ncbi:MAG: transglutaminase domain-containing protein [Candidatus Hydrogenedentota bacterium]
MTRTFQLIMLCSVSMLQWHTQADVASRTVELTYRADVTDIPDTTEHLAVWLPLPASNKFQVVTKIRLTASHTYKVLLDDKFKNRFHYIQIEGEEAIQALKEDRAWVQVTATITRYARNSLDTQFTMHNPRGDLARFLAPSSLIPIDGRIAIEAQTTVGSETAPLKQAQLLYNDIVKTVQYDKSGDGWGRGDALYACDVRAGNCTDFHSLFIGEARSLNIPARFIMGFPLPPTQSQGELEGYHCWAEFFVPSKGWVPVDASEAHKNPEKHDLFFGGLDENRIEFTMGRDIQLPRSGSGAINYSIYPHLEVNGESNDSVEATITFKDSE